jgi:hypothetical protein
LDAPTPADRSAAFADLSAAPACGSCVDLAADSPMVQRERHDAPAPEGRAECIDALSAMFKKEACNRTRTGSDVDHRPQALACLATDVLLI